MLPEHRVQGVPSSAASVPARRRLDPVGQVAVGDGRRGRGHLLDRAHAEADHPPAPRGRAPPAPARCRRPSTTISRSHGGVDLVERRAPTTTTSPGTVARLGQHPVAASDPSVASTVNGSGRLGRRGRRRPRSTGMSGSGSSLAGDPGAEHRVHRRRRRITPTYSELSGPPSAPAGCGIGRLEYRPRRRRGRASAGRRPGRAGSCSVDAGDDHAPRRPAPRRSAPCRPARGRAATSPMPRASRRRVADAPDRCG